jgi:hypothetical protein
VGKDVHFKEDAPDEKMDEARDAFFSGKAVIVRGSILGKRGKSACLGVGSRSRPWSLWLTCSFERWARIPLTFSKI